MGVMFDRSEVMCCHVDLLQQELPNFRRALLTSCFTLVHMEYVVGFFLDGRMLWSCVNSI